MITFFAVGGATWVSIHSRGGVGVGNSMHAGQVIVADGTSESARRLDRVLNTDPGTAIIGHADAEDPEAISAARGFGVPIPMLEEETGWNLLFQSGCNGTTLRAYPGPSYNNGLELLKACRRHS